MTAQTASPSVQFPRKLQPLFQPKRFKVLHGGRGGAKSWGIARALILIASQKKVRVLCLRELQKSMEDSVHKLLSDQIDLMNLGHLFDIEKKEIRCLATGSTFSFEGIKNNTRKVKSYEGIDICWIEEAAKISKASFQVVTPTIRKDGSEVWLSFNAELESDYIYQRFVVKEDPQAIVIKMSHRDNPWFTDTMQRDMEADRLEDEDSYMNVWEGFPLKKLAGAIYAKELRDAELQGRITLVPWMKEYPVDTYWDLGRADNTAIWFAQHVAKQDRILSYYECSGEDITHFMKVLQDKGFIYGDHYLPHDGKAKLLGTKLSIQETLETKYPKRVHIVPKQSVADGINAARLLLSRSWFDEEECSDGLNVLRNYRYKVIDGQRSNTPLHDWASDGADAFRTMAMSRRLPRSDSSEVMRRMNEGRAQFFSKTARAVGGALGWMG